MKLRTIVVSVVALSLMLGTKAFAHTTIFGSTGLIFNPTAGVLPRGQFSAQASYYKEEPAGFDLRAFSLSVATGIAPGWEVAIGVQDAKADSSGFTFFDMSGMSGGIKYQWRAESANSPAVAVGVEFVNIIKRGSAYVVLSKSLTSKQSCDMDDDWRVHGGIRFDRVKDIRSFTGNDESQFTLFGGIEAPIAKRLRFMGEFNQRHDAYATSPYSATLHFNLSDNATLFGGIARLGTSAETGWMVGVNYGWG